MEERKQKEIEHYDKRAESWLENGKKKKDNPGDFQSLLLSSFKFVHNFLKEKCKNKKVLDYGCGDGIHSVWLAGLGAEIKAIDLSEKFLQIAKARVGAESVEFLKMDCEMMNFPDSYFDIIFDGGAFSSLDFKKALSELRRVLKPEGFVIGVETFGHNPFTNLKRKINKITKRRTEWAVNHIMRNKDLELAKEYFNKIEIHYFHLISWPVFPFLNLPGGKFALKSLETIESFLLFIFPFLRRYCFKITFILSEPQKFSLNNKTC